jgi:hypothetical protein
MMLAPAMVGVIERRILLNYRLDPEWVSRLLPEPLRPQLVGGASVGGICLIRLGRLRPAGLPAALGVTTENAAHRLAVEWPGPDGTSQGVYIPRRDTSSRLTAAVGGRLFPGEHHRAGFFVFEDDHNFEVAFRGLDGTVGAAVRARLADRLPTGSVFASLDEASEFFRGAPVGYSPSHRGQHQAVELRCNGWRIEPLEVVDAHSSFFDDTTLFPVGTAAVDSGLLMRDIPATWLAREPSSWQSTASVA